ncbi:delta-1-pyrroline-5-carboxylate synthase [Phtheirospermum japonicum]|uniref:Delta-1-pyrroline-5-carboxylate synthase n=1 Tax=Phtheirospermum japonicum TaxID=374723 RepID=A0A830CW56_9LAMI|nr:delta-1-pyrroline-5-carboxylate synthase [Phtheirospermum japonicum]
MDPTRAFVKHVKRVVFKVGTAVVTRSDGRLAVGRVGAIFEQLQQLNSQGYEIILVTSGAVGAGRQRLKYRRLLNSRLRLAEKSDLSGSFADLQKPQVEIDGKACAAVGQNGLMALYDSLFSQLDITSSQLLVTDNDFKNPEFRNQLSQTVNSLLSLRSIPIFNENDAISTRRAPYEDSTGIFWDNDSLAALLALELKADLLVLLSDVEGLYSGPPNDPNSKMIYTYVKQKHLGAITFGDKSRVGRGGMTAKVKAAVGAADAGTPVIIARDAHTWTSLDEFGARDMALAAREKILSDVADVLEAKASLIEVENEGDVEAAHEAGYDESLISRLISKLAKNIRVLAEMEEPIGQIMKKTELAEGLVLEKTTCPLGVLLIIFESRPDALVQIASLAIRSGNGLLLKGGKEARRTNAILHKVITSAIPETVGEKLIGLVTSKEDIPDLLKLDDVIDLVIPRGSNRLVSQIKAQTKIPVLGHSDGICHVYIDKSANMEMAKHLVVDSKLDYPAACNAMDLSSSAGLQDLLVELSQGGVTFYGGPRSSSLLNVSEAISFHHEYSSRACTIEIVDDVGISTSKIHARGPVGVEGLLTTKWVLRGNGHIVQKDEGVDYTHKNLSHSE